MRNTTGLFVVGCLFICVASIASRAEEPVKEPPRPSLADQLRDAEPELYRVPEVNDTAKLVAFCKAIQEFRPKSQKEAAEQQIRAAPAIVDACKKILDLEPGDASAAGHFARQTLARMGMGTLRNPQSPAFEPYLQVVAKLADYSKLDENDGTLLLQIAGMMDSARVDKANPSRVKIEAASERYFSDLGALAESGKMEPKDVPAALRYATVVQMLRPEKAAELARKLDSAVGRYIDESGRLSESGKLDAKDVPAALGAVSCLELVFPGKDDVFLKRIDKAIDKYLGDEAKAVETDALQAKDVSRAMSIGSTMQYVDSAKAAQFYDRIGKTFEKSALPICTLAMKSIPATLRRLRLPGNVMELKGRTMDGKEFNLASLTGKVVLVDFWATWCGPCRAEMPNVKKNYAAYHGKGFEVVGVSVDEDRDALEGFLKETPLPWATVHEMDGIRYKPVEAIENYSIHSFPTTVLVGKDGKVVRLDVRGEKLGRMLKELLGEPDAQK